MQEYIERQGVYSIGQNGKLTLMVSWLIAILWCHIHVTNQLQQILNVQTANWKHFLKVMKKAIRVEKMKRRNKNRRWKVKVGGKWKRPFTEEIPSPSSLCSLPSNNPLKKEWAVKKSEKEWKVKIPKYQPTNHLLGGRALWKLSPCWRWTNLCNSVWKLIFQCICKLMISYLQTVDFSKYQISKLMEYFLL